MKQYNDSPTPPVKGGRTLFYIFSIIIITLLAVLLLAVVVTKQSGKPIMLLNHGMMILDTENMGDTIPKDSVIIIRGVDTDTLSVDDVITFKETDKGVPATVTARIARLDPTPDGLNFYTSGDISPAENLNPKTEKDIYGEVIAVSPEFGKFLMFVKSPFGLAVCIALPLALLLLIEIINLFKISKKASRSEPTNYNNDNDNAQRFGTRIHDFEENKKPSKHKKDDEEVLEPLNIEQIRTNISDKVKGLKQSGFQATSLFEAVTQNNIADTQEFEPFEPPEHITPFKIYTRDEDDDYEEEAEFKSPRSFKIEPLDESRVRITPHKITTKAEEEAELLSHKILSIRDDLLLEEEIIENMGEFEFERPDELMAAMSDSVKNKHPFSRNKARLALRKDRQGEFISTIQNGGRDHFNLEGIDVRVKPNALRLNLEDENNSRDVVITVTDEYTSVTIDGDSCQVNFALFKDTEDGKQKVVIQKKNIDG